MLVSHKHFIIEYFNNRKCQMKGARSWNWAIFFFHFFSLVNGAWHLIAILKLHIYYVCASNVTNPLNLVCFPNYFVQKIPLNIKMLTQFAMDYNKFYIYFPKCHYSKLGLLFMKLLQICYSLLWNFVFWTKVRTIGCW
jgi:hypothetical protein